MAKPPPLTYSISALNADQPEGDAGTTAYTFTVTRSSGTGKTSVAYSLTGAQPSDFVGGVNPSGTVTFRSGETSKVITIPVAGDTAVEGDENFSVALSSPSKGTIATGTAGGVIRNDDFYQVSIAPLSAVKPEGDSGPTAYTFTVSRTGGTADAVTVHYAVDGAGDVDAADFGGTLPEDDFVIPAGQASATLTINVSGDAAIEPDEDFTVLLSDLSPTDNAQIADGDATGTIQNDDAYQVSIAPLDAVSPEGDTGTTAFTFTVSRTGGTDGAVTVDYAVTAASVGLTAADFGGTLPSGTVTIDDGQASETLTLNVSGDTDVEFDEEFTVTLSDPSANAEIADGDASGTIENDDVAEIQRVSVSSAGAQGNSFSQSPRISADGRYVTFLSFAGNLVTGDTNGDRDTFVRDLLLGTTERVSVTSAEAQAFGGTGSGLSSVSGDGRYVGFYSSATNLAAGDTNGTFDAFVRDRQLGTTERVSVDSAEAQANGDSIDFFSPPGTAANGSAIAFKSDAPNLVAGDTNAGADIFVRELAAGTTERVSVNSNEEEATGPISVAPNSEQAVMSQTGRYVAFRSNAVNLVEVAPGVFGDVNGGPDIFVRDRQTGVTEVVSVNSAEQGGSVGIGGSALNHDPAMSADGRYVAFRSNAENFVTDSNGAYDIFVRDRVNGTTERVSVDSNEVETDADPVLPHSFDPSISADGRYVVFSSQAENLVGDDTNEALDIFVRDRVLGTTSRVSVNAAGVQGNGDSDAPSISGDGRYVAFRSIANNLVPGDTNADYDVFVVDGQAQGWWFP